MGAVFVKRLDNIPAKLFYASKGMNAGKWVNATPLYDNTTSGTNAGIETGGNSNS